MKIKDAWPNVDLERGSSRDWLRRTLKVFFLLNYMLHLRLTTTLRLNKVDCELKASLTFILGLFKLSFEVAKC